MTEKETKVDQKRTIATHLFELDSKTLQEAADYLRTIGVIVKPDLLEGYLRNQIGSAYFSMEKSRIKIKISEDDWKFIQEIEQNVGRRKTAENTSPHVSETTLSRRRSDTGGTIPSVNQNGRHTRPMKRD